MIPTFFPTCRGQQPMRAGGRQAADAAHHRAQRVRIEGSAPAHLAARQTLLVLVVADADCCACSLHAAVEIMVIVASSNVSDLSNHLSKSREEQRRTQHAPSAVVQLALVMRLQPKKWGSPRSAGSKHGGHGAAHFFRQPLRAWWRRMKGQSPVRRARKMPRRGEDEH